jgi:hypothetical protein
MDTAPPTWIHLMLSVPRFERYLRDAGGDVDRAILLYWWNVEVSGAFFGPLHCLEVTLRNALHHRLSARYGIAEWWKVAPLAPEGLRKTGETAAAVRSRRGQSYRPDDVVTELSLGFWVALLSRRYDRPFWVPTLHRAFPHYKGPRRDLHDSLVSVQFLRNRIMHHEPVHHRDLIADHAKIYRLIGYISDDVRQNVGTLDRVPDALARKARIYDDGHRPSF